MRHHLCGLLCLHGYQICLLQTTRVLTCLYIVRIEMFLTCKHLAIIDLILEVFVNDSPSSAHLATLPATSCILHFVVSTV